MGLHGFFQLLAELNVLGQRMSPEETKNHAVELDLFGCYYYLIKHCLVEQDMLSLKKARQQQQQQQENYTRLYIDEHNPEAYTRTAPSGSTHPAVNALHRALSRRFSPERTRFHAGDRFSTTQKRVGQEDRVKQKETSHLQKLASAVEHGT